MSTVLWLGAGAPSERLRSRSIEVVEARPDPAHVVSTAPDVVVVAGAAFSISWLDGPCAARPIAVLGPDDDAEVVGRFGVVARWRATLEPDVLAARIDDLLARLDSPLNEVASVSGDARETWLARIADRCKTGFIVRADGAAAMLDRERREVPREIAEGSTLRLVEVPADRLRTASNASTCGPLAGARVLVVDVRVSHRASTCAALRSAGALVAVLDAHQHAVEESIAMVPSVVVMSAEAMRAGIAGALWSNDRFSGASFVIVEAWEEEWVIAAAAQAARVEMAVGEAIGERGVVVDRLEPFGPARWLKVLAGLGREVAFRLTSPSGSIAVEIAGSKLKSATWARADGSVVPGKGALAALLRARRGQVIAGKAELVEEESRRAPKDRVRELAPIVELPAPRPSRPAPSKRAVPKKPRPGPRKTALGAPSGLPARTRPSVPPPARTTPPSDPKPPVIEALVVEENPPRVSRTTPRVTPIAAKRDVRPSKLPDVALERRRARARRVRLFKNIAAATIGAGATLIVMFAIAAWMRSDRARRPEVQMPREAPPAAHHEPADPVPHVRVEITSEQPAIEPVDVEPPDGSRLHYTLAQVLFEQRRDIEALAEIEQAIELAPTADYYLLAGDIHWRSRRLEPAATAWRECRALDPSYGPCRARLSGIRGRLPP